MRSSTAQDQRMQQIAIPTYFTILKHSNYLQNAETFLFIYASRLCVQFSTGGFALQVLNILRTLKMPPRLRYTCVPGNAVDT